MELHGIVSQQFCSTSSSTTSIHFVNYEVSKLFTKDKIMKETKVD